MTQVGYGRDREKKNIESQVRTDRSGRHARTFEQRYCVIEMLANHIRSPLMSSLRWIGLIEELSESISEEAFVALESVRKILEYTLNQGELLLHQAMMHIHNPKARNAPRVKPDTNGLDETSRLNIMQSTACLTKEIRILLIDALKLLQSVEQLECKELTQVAKEHLQCARDGIHRGINLIDGQMRIESLLNDLVYLQKSACSVFPFAEEVIFSLKTLADQKNIQLVYMCPSDVANFDRSKVAHVLSNFLSNAIKFSPEGKRIYITCHCSYRKVLLAVIDEGTGMEEETRRHAFEQFPAACSERSMEIYGFSLFVCKLIADAHGGEVGVDSIPGKGSVFWMELPR